MNKKLLRLGNRLFERCYFLYRPLYAGYKAISDRQERVLIRRLVRPGMIVVDVGANIGIYTRLFAQLVGAKGRVFAFEPAPANYSHLKDNVAKFANVAAVQSAVGDSSGQIGLFVSDSLNVDHHAYDSGEGRRRVNVPIVRLDDYFEKGQNVDLLKIDVQGYEFSVLNGASRVLRESPNVSVIMEFWPYGLSKAGVESHALFELIMAMGFSMHSTGVRLNPLFNPEDLDPEKEGQYCNLLLKRKFQYGNNTISSGHFLPSATNAKYQS